MRDDHEVFWNTLTVALHNDHWRQWMVMPFPLHLTIRHFVLSGSCQLKMNLKCTVLRSNRSRLDWDNSPAAAVVHFEPRTQFLLVREVGDNNNIENVCGKMKKTRPKIFIKKSDLICRRNFRHNTELITGFDDVKFRQNTDFDKK